MKMKKRKILFLVSLLVFIIGCSTTAFAATCDTSSNKITPFAVVPHQCPYGGKHHGKAIRYDHGYWSNLGPADRMTYLYQCECGSEIVCTGRPSYGQSVGNYSTNFKKAGYRKFDGIYEFIIYGTEYSSDSSLFYWDFN